jgi:hypothetical protein
MRASTRHNLEAQVDGLQRTVTHLATTLSYLQSQLDDQRRAGRHAACVRLSGWKDWWNRRLQHLEHPSPRPNLRRACHDGR